METAKANSTITTSMTFKIDLIVWKQQIKVQEHYLKYKFKIDLIVWKPAGWGKS